MHMDLFTAQYARSDRPLLDDVARRAAVLGPMSQRNGVAETASPPLAWGPSTIREHPPPVAAGTRSAQYGMSADEDGPPTANEAVTADPHIVPFRRYPDLRRYGRAGRLLGRSREERR
jgi:hypothetical protein